MSMKEKTTGIAWSGWPLSNRPLDGKTWFNTLEEALKDIIPGERYKGLKFTVKGLNGEDPKEYWFVKDYSKASNNWIEDPPGSGNWVPEFPEFIPTLENGGLQLYQSGGGGGTLSEELDPVAMAALGEYSNKTIENNVNGIITYFKLKTNIYNYLY